MPVQRALTTLALLSAAAVALVGCSTSAAAPAETAAAPATISVDDNHGTQTVPANPGSVVALDNRTFETLSDWGVELAAAAVALMPDTIAYAQDDAIVDVGNHREPNLELIVAAAPDLVISGQRFSDRDAELAALVPEAAILQLEPREGERLDEELRRQVTVLGEVFGKQAEAAQLVADFDAAIERAAGAYDAAETTMAVTTSGGEIGYLAPSVGRTLGPIFDLLELTPALEVDGASDDHQGDDISVEAIADADPDWILVMDRDAAILADDPEFMPAADILEHSEALAGVAAVQQGNLVYMPADTYTNESIQTYTEFLTAFADALEAAN
ncbi:ABC transporter substrate-binding protein [Agrococcus sp. ProA11]|uniref:siderophore ABC transporter substrate-binding protein n=1 Tax=Agrococcus chionoecetis TaxID=3153752 RepID=UPI0032610086